MSSVLPPRSTVSEDVDLHFESTMLSLLLPALLAVQAMGGCRRCLHPAIRAESLQWEVQLSFKQCTLRAN